MSAKGTFVLDDNGDARINPQTGQIDRPGWLRRYITRHWEGRLPLPLAFWVNTIALSAVLLLLEAAAVTWIWSHAQPWLATMVVIGAYAFVRLLLAIWQVTGTLRSAALLDNRWAFLTNLAMALVIPALLAMVLVYAYEAHALSPLSARAFGVYIGPRAALSSAGDAIEADGPIDYSRVKALLAVAGEHPQVHRLRLKSITGDVSAALVLGDYLTSHPDMAVEVDDQCEDVCPLVFLSANQRLVKPDATVSFTPIRTYDDAGLVRHLTLVAQQRMRARLAQLDASSFFIDYAIGNGNTTGYRPDAGTMFDNHVLTGVVLDGRVVEGQAWRSEQFIRPLRSDPRFHDMVHALDTLRVRYPDVFRSWITEAQASRYEPSQKARETAVLRANVHALEKAYRHSARDATAQALQQAAIAQRDDLEEVRADMSGSICGQYIYGGSTNLGSRHAEYFFAAIKRLDGLISAAPSTGTAAVDNPPADAAALQDARASVVSKWRRVPGADVYDLACRRTIALLDVLASDTSAPHTMALRALVATPNDPHRNDFLFSP